MSRALTRSRTDNPLAAGGIRPYGRAQAVRRRLAHMAAEGYTAGEIADVEGLTAEQVEELLGDERFSRLVRAYKVLEAKPLEIRHERLVKLALHLIEEAISLGHVRVGFYVVREKLRARHAAEVVVEKLIRQRAKAAEPLPPQAPPAAEPSSESPKPRLPAHAADRMAQRAQSQLMLALLGENRVREEGKARAIRRDLDAAKARRLAGGLPPHLEERHRRLVERLQAMPDPAADPPPGPGACPPKRSRAP